MIIKSVEALDNYSIAIQSDNGRTGTFDVRPYLSYEAFEALNKLENFKKLFNGGYYIEWACGADLSADTIEAKLVYNSGSNVVH